LPLVKVDGVDGVDFVDDMDLAVLSEPSEGMASLPSEANYLVRRERVFSIAVVAER
jgi:hypothetical protein